MKFFLIITGLLVVNSLCAQENWQLKLGDEWFIKYGSKGLQVGDTMPDIPLGKVMNNYTGKTRFSEFKGKLLILDVWSTRCSICIASFPHMEKLQQEFGDAIQIILLNNYETKEKIIERQKEINFKLPNLPCIVADRLYTSEEDVTNAPLYRLFPVRENPHHIWIDAKGIIRLRGSGWNTYPEKIREILEGKDVASQNSSSTLASLGKEPYYKQLSNLKSTPLAYGSFITPYNNELTRMGSFRELTDSTAHTRITRFINEQLLSLYYQSIRKVIGKQLGNNIWTGGMEDFLIFSKGIDTSRYSYYIVKGKKIKTEKELMKSEYCYEQIAPLDLPEEERQAYMLEDLNRYFGQHYGSIGEIETRSISCYTLVRIPTTAKSPAEASDLDSKKEVIVENGQQLARYTSYPLAAIIESTIKSNPALVSMLEKNKANGKSYLIINETGWSNMERMDMLLPVGTLITINDLKAALRPYGLDIIERKKEFQFLVFRKK